MRRVHPEPGQAEQQQAGALGALLTLGKSLWCKCKAIGTRLSQWCAYKFVCASLWWLFMTLPHIVWGILRAFVFAITGYFRPGPGNDLSQVLAQGYAEHPYAPWKGVFMGYVWELATVNRGQEPPTHVTSPPAPATAPPWPGYSPKDHLFVEYDNAAAGGDASASVTSSVAARLGVTRQILQHAGKETRDRLSSELSTMMTVCTFIGGFIFTTLAPIPVGLAGGASGAAGSDRTPIVMITLPSNMSSNTTQFFSNTSVGGNSTGNSINHDDSDAYRLLAGLTIILAITCVGIYARLLVMLQWAATTTSLYRLIATWQRAMSGNQLLFFIVLTLSYASALAACWDGYGGNTHWVFMVLLGLTVFLWWFFANFWAQSIWSNDIGAMQRHSRLFHQRILGRDQGMFASACSLTAQKVPIEDVKYTFYGLLDQHLLGKNYPGP